MRTAYTALIQSIAQAKGLDADLLEAQVLTESGGDRFALRYEKAYFQNYVLNKNSAVAAHYGPLAACSYGLLQILLETAYEIGFTGRPEDLFDAETGLTWGVAYLVSLRARTGTTDAMLAAFNGGLVGNLAPPLRNHAYVTRVLEMKATL